MRKRGKTVGEFVLIVVGVFVALMLDTMMSQRHDGELRLEYLSRLEADIATDKQAFEYRIEFFTGVQQFSQELLDWLDSDVPMDHSTLLAAFYAAEIWPYLPGMSTYHDLQSTGNLRLIDNIDLRTNLFRYYSPLRDDAAFRSILTYRHSELGVMLGLFRQQVAFADDVLDNM